MTPDEARARFAAARVARLATMGPDGPHLVPVCFAVDGDLIWTAIDAKPKRPGRLRRLRNIDERPAVALLADHYDDADWSALWWVRADGHARVHDAPPAHALALLRERYVQYREQPPAGPAIEVRVERWSGWAAAFPGP
jgi:PPOX class probable F420-dependent enzyme